MQQHRGAVERPGEQTPCPGRELPRAEEGHSALAEEMAEGPDGALRRHRRVRDEDVEGVEREIGEQPPEAVLAAYEADFVGMLERRLQEPVHHTLRHHVGDTDGEAGGQPRRPPLHRIEHFVPEREDLLGVAVDHPAHLGERELAAGTGEQLLAQPILEGVDLAAQRRVRKPERPPRPRQAALPRHGEEVEQVMVVEPFHEVSARPTDCFKTS